MHSSLFYSQMWQVKGVPIGNLALFKLLIDTNIQ